MPSPVILARNNIAFTRPDYNLLSIDPQAPEAQQLYAAGAVPPSRPPNQISGFTLQKADKTPYTWPIAYSAALGTQADPVVGSFARASGTTTKYTITLNPPPPATSQGTLAVWVRRRGGLVAGTQIASLPSIGLQIGTDASTPLFFLWNNASAAQVTGLIVPLDEWALAVGVHKDGLSTCYLFSAGIDLSFGPYADTNVVRVPASVAAGGTGSTSVGADYADVAFWARAFTPDQVRALWDPATRWRRYYVPKTYWQFGDTPVADTQPLAAQPPRPRYIRLNTFSPQAQGLFAWMPAVDGALVQANVPGNSKTGGLAATNPSNIPNQVVPRVTVALNGASTDVVPAVPTPALSDLGLVPVSVNVVPTMPNPQSLAGQFFQPNVDTSGLRTTTLVYWIYPRASNIQGAVYWATNAVNDSFYMTNTQINMNGPSVLYTDDPHIRGRWQMITASHDGARLRLWRDQELLIDQANATAPPLSDRPPWFQIGGFAAGVGDLLAVNALWADFRIYNRAWNQGDVNYAYNPATRWDYYYKPKTTPYEDIPIGPPPSSGFLSRLALMGAG